MEMAAAIPACGGTYKLDVQVLSDIHTHIQKEHEYTMSRGKIYSRSSKESGKA